MGRKSKIAAVVLGISVFLGGCSLGKTDIVFTTGLSANEVFKIEHEKVSLAEAKVYLCNYQNLYGNVYGIDLWEQQYQTDDLEQYVKDVTLSEMTRVICMDQLAEQKEITLSKEEKTNLKLAAKEYYESLNEEEKSYMDVSEATIEKLYENYALASKVYTSLTTGVNEEVSDDEARVMEAQQIYVAAVLGSHVVHAVAVLSAEVLLVKVEKDSGAQLCAFVEWGVILGILESVIASYPCA